MTNLPSNNNISALTDFVDLLKIQFGDMLSEVLLFGSFARGDFDNSSDVDVMVLLNSVDSDILKFSPVVSDIAYQIIQKYNIPLSTITNSKSYFDSRKYAPGLYNNVFNEGITFYDRH